MGGGASFSKSGNYSNSWQGQQTNFPLNYLSQAAGIYGAPISAQSLLQGLPQTTSLFGGQQVGVGPAGMYGGGGGYGGGYGPSPYSSSPNPYASGPGAYSPMGGGGGQLPYGNYGGGGSGPPPQSGGQNGMGIPQGPSAAPQGSYGAGAPGGSNAPQGSVGYGQVLGWLQQTGIANPHTQVQNEQELNASMQALGIDPSGPISPQQLQALGQYAFQKYGNTPGASSLSAQVPAFAQEYGQLAANPTQFSSSGTPNGLNVNQGLSNLGIGQMSAPIQAPTIGQAPTIQGPQAATAQMNIAPSGFDAYQQNLYQQQFAPVQQQQQIQNQIANQQLGSDLASRGLASSGSGVGQMQLQRQQQAIQLNNASIQASNNAAVQRFGAQFGQAQQNAQLQQQTALANAGFDQQAQTQNAQNVLTGNIQNATAYLQAAGLTTQQAQNERADFLQTMGLQESDLQRMDSQQLASLGMVLNNWLQQTAVVSNAGAVSRGQSGAGGESVGQSASGGA